MGHARPARLERATYWFEARRSIQLSYGRIGEIIAQYRFTNLLLKQTTCRDSSNIIKFKNSKNFIGALGRYHMKKLVGIVIFIGLLLPLCIAQAASSWYFPEGSTRAQHTLWMTVTNPNSSPATVKYTFYTGSSGTYQHIQTVAANSRGTIDVRAVINTDYSELVYDDISTKVECTNGLKIYAERVLYAADDNWGQASRGVSGLEGCYFEISQPEEQSDFPITLSQSGSYKLTSNITVSSNDTNAIYVTASHVTIDLNGFTITGPGYDQGDEGHGIYVDGDNGTEIYNINIFNGNVYNFRGFGIYCEYVINFNIHNINAYNNGQSGIYCSASYAGVVTQCCLTSNGHSDTSSNACGLRIYADTIAEKNSLYSNNNIGIYVKYRGNIVRHNTISDTANSTSLSAAIYLSAGRSVIENNICYNNKNYGIYINQGFNTIYRNSITGTTSKGIYTVTNNSNRIEGNNCVDNTGTDIDNNSKNNFYYYNTTDDAISNLGTSKTILDGDGLNAHL